ncbi:hypothetical protein ACHAWU_004599 [Discostella pseudostelligera]|uniref:Uncharacterized protein n=1 Tax=Discostella pseudostelligera TaxID=259834 RepID=A0ABD3M0H6_9STRA
MAQSSSSTTCISTSDSSSEDVSSPPPSPQQHGNDDKRSNVVASLTRDEFCIQSALSMYRAFADYSVSSNQNNLQQNIGSVLDNAECDTVKDDQWATNASIDEEDERTSSNHLGNANSSPGGNAEHGGQSWRWSSLDDAHSNKNTSQAREMSNKKRSVDSDEANDDDNESFNSLTSSSSPTPTNLLCSSTDFLHRHRRGLHRSYCRW